MNRRLTESGDLSMDVRRMRGTPKRRAVERERSRGHPKASRMSGSRRLPCGCRSLACGARPDAWRLALHQGVDVRLRDPGIDHLRPRRGGPRGAMNQVDQAVRGPCPSRVGRPGSLVDTMEEPQCLPDPEVRRHQRRRPRQDPRRGQSRHPCPSRRRPGRRGRRPRAGHRRADRDGPATLRAASSARAGHAPVHRRAGQHRAHGHRHPGARCPSDQLHGGGRSGSSPTASVQGADPEHLHRADRPALDEGKIVVVAGFQGVDKDYNITTLGRTARTRPPWRWPRCWGRRLGDTPTSTASTDRPAGRARGAEGGPDQLRRDARAGQPGGPA